MKFLGIDYGSKRIGIAVSDEEGTIAFPKTAISGENMKRAIAELRAIVRSEHISEIIVGFPQTMRGGDSTQAVVTRAFVDALRRAVRIPVAFENEVLTTKIAKSGGVIKERVDAASAALILQSYLDHTRASV